MKAKGANDGHPQCGHHLFEDQAVRSPDAIAAVFKEQALTYNELNQKANRLAHYLGSLDVTTESLVGIYMDRSMEMLVALLGVLKAGGAYIPLDPDYPVKRLSYMIENAEMPVLITLASHEKDLPSNNAQIVCLDKEKDIIAEQSPENPGTKEDQKTISPDHLAYVIYTSGSTGNPKGVQVPHGAVVNFLSSMAEKPGVTEADTLLAVTTLSFDISVLELFLPISVGGCVVIADLETLSDGAKLLECLRKTKTTVMQATPVTWRMLIDSGWNGTPELKVICGGEALPRDLANALIDRSKSVWNMYGPTETTVWSTCYRLSEKEGPVMIGRPIANTQVYILDKHMQPVPVGVKGELFIGGAGLSRGYLKRPDLTEKVFVRNPFTSDPNNLIYKTGDVTRYHTDGNIEYLNRADHQVKVRGFRIELGEIETILSQEPSIKQGVALVREDTPGDARLVAYVNLKEGMTFNTQEYRQFLREKLPEYMIPQHFVPIEDFPRTPNGKIDRKALPKPDINRQDRENYVVPETDVEQQLAEIWSSVIHVDKIGLDDGFFDLGGHSILAIQMISRVRETFQVELTLRTVFEIPKLRDLARHVEALQFAVAVTSTDVLANDSEREEIEF